MGFCCCWFWSHVVLICSRALKHTFRGLCCVISFDWSVLGPFQGNPPIGEEHFTLCLHPLNFLLSGHQCNCSDCICPIVTSLTVHLSKWSLMTKHCSRVRPLDPLTVKCSRMTATDVFYIIMCMATWSIWLRVGCWCILLFFASVCLFMPLSSHQVQCNCIQTNKIRQTFRKTDN